MWEPCMKFLELGTSTLLFYTNYNFVLGLHVTNYATIVFTTVFSITLAEDED